MKLMVQFTVLCISHQQDDFVMLHFPVVYIIRTTAFFNINHIIILICLFKPFSQEADYPHPQSKIIILNPRSFNKFRISKFYIKKGVFQTMYGLHFLI